MRQKKTADSKCQLDIAIEVTDEETMFGMVNPVYYTTSQKTDTVET